MQNLKRRIITALVLFLVLNTIAIAGYWYLADGEASMVDVIYMAATTIGSVGYGEITKNSGTPHGRIFTTVLIYLNMVALVYVTTSVTAFLLEGELLRILEKRKMDKRLDTISGHFIVCGAGSTGVHIIRELCLTERPTVFIEHNEERARAVYDEMNGMKKAKNLAYLLGDASDDELLLQAGIQKAVGLVAALPTDKDNLFITVTARQMMPNLRIIARASEPHTFEKLKRAGAHSVVSPNMIGGLRMVSELVRPSVVTFLDLMLRDKDKAMRIEEISIGKTEYVGRTLDSSGLRANFDCSVLAVRPPNADGFIYNPAPTTLFSEGMTLVVLGSAERVNALRAACAGVTA